MSEAHSVSVIIPTYNRKDSLLHTIQSLTRQTCPAHDYEVIVVDDGSIDGTQTMAEGDFPFGVKHIHQPHRGATLARNAGAVTSDGEFLIFLDDDIELMPQTIESLRSELSMNARSVVLGTLLTPGLVDVECSVPGVRPEGHAAAVPFTECYTGLLAVRRNDFRALGMFQDPTGGWPNWDDIDFGYRAHLAGFRLIRNYAAIAIHHDQSTVELHRVCRRSFQASKSAVRLFKKYPAIQSEFHMFHDKTPIDWRHDPPRLFIRKLLRQIVSSRPLLGLLERTAKGLEGVCPSPRLLRPLYRWTIGGYIFRGYRQGLREYATA